MDSKETNQSTLKEINPEYSLEELMLKLKLQYFDLMQRANSLEKALMLGQTEGKRRRGWQKRWLDSITDLLDLSLSKLWEIVKDQGMWRAAVHRVAVGTDVVTAEQNGNFLKKKLPYIFSEK